MENSRIVFEIGGNSIYIYIYIYMIKQCRHLLSTHFYIYPFESLLRFYVIRRELVNKPPIINWFPSTFFRRLYH